LQAYTRVSRIFEKKRLKNHLSNETNKKDIVGFAAVNLKSILRGLNASQIGILCFNLKEAPSEEV